MGDALVIAIQSMQNDMSRMESINRNIGNFSTPGYQRELAVVRPFGTLLAQPVAVDGAGRPERALDVSAGALTLTGRPFDLALAGPGYFALATADGPAYTRAGSFHIDADGRLVNEAGLAVLGQAGEIVVRGANVTVDTQGQVLQGGRVVAQIKTVQFAHPERLAPGRAGALFVADRSMLPSDSKTALRVGYLEGSNTAATREMVSMTETVRHFETAQKIYQAYDEQLRSAVQEIGKF